GGLDDLGMRARGRADVDDVDIRPLDDLAPVGRPLLDAVPPGGLRDRPFVASADDEQPRRTGQVAHARCDCVPVRVRPAHQPVADDPDADFGLGAHPRATTESDSAARSAASIARNASSPVAPSCASPRTAAANASAWATSAAWNTCVPSS